MSTNMKRVESEEVFLTTADTQTQITAPTGPIKMESRNLSVYYGNNHAIKNVSLPIPEKQVTAFMGPSGCGKSTFLRALNRMHDLLPAARVTGEIIFNGKNIYAPN